MTHTLAWTARNWANFYDLETLIAHSVVNDLLAQGRSTAEVALGMGKWFTVG